MASLKEIVIGAGGAITVIGGGYVAVDHFTNLPREVDLATMVKLAAPDSDRPQMVVHSLKNLGDEVSVVGENGTGIKIHRQQNGEIILDGDENLVRSIDGQQYILGYYSGRVNGLSTHSVYKLIDGGDSIKIITGVFTGTKELWLEGKGGFRFPEVEEPQTDYEQKVGRVVSATSVVVATEPRKETDDCVANTKMEKGTEYIVAGGSEGRLMQTRYGVAGIRTPEYLKGGSKIVWDGKEWCEIKTFYSGRPTYARTRKP